jgi:hypothetical protein
MAAYVETETSDYGFVDEGMSDYIFIDEEPVNKNIVKKITLKAFLH